MPATTSIWVSMLSQTPAINQQLLICRTSLKWLVLWHTHFSSCHCLLTKEIVAAASLLINWLTGELAWLCLTLRHGSMWPTSRDRAQKSSQVNVGVLRPRGNSRQQQHVCNSINWASSNSNCNGNRQWQLGAEVEAEAKVKAETRLETTDRKREKCWQLRTATRVT